MLNLETLQPVDINALNDGPQNVSNIMAAFVFHEKCEPEMIREVFVEKQSSMYRRYRSSLVKVADSYYFKEMGAEQLRKALDAAFIVREDITNKEDFALLCQEQQTRMFPENGLQWAIYFCPNYEHSQSLMMLKVHHVLGDGLGLLYMFATLQDSYDANQFIQTTTVISTLQKVIMAAIKPFIAVYALAWFVFFKRDRNSLSDRQLSGQKTVSYSKPFDVQKLKAIGQKYKATINDVVLGITSVTMKQYLESNKDKCQSLNLVIPFSMREVPKRREDHKLNNDFTLLCFTLQLREKFSDACTAVSLQTKKLKKSLYPFAVSALCQFASLCPTALSLILTD